MRKIIKHFALALMLMPISIGFASDKNKTDTNQIIKQHNMNNNQHYIDAVDNYIRGLNEKNLEGILKLYADDATVEDPVGSKVISVKAAIRQFYSGAVNIDMTLTRTGPVRIAGVEVAFPFQLRMVVEGTPMITDIIDVFRFDESGKIVSMRHFGEKVIEDERRSKGSTPKSY